VGSGQWTSARPFANQDGSPTDDEKHCRQDDPPEAELRKADRVREVEHVPSEPEEERGKQDHHREHCSRDR